MHSKLVLCFELRGDLDRLATKLRDEIGQDINDVALKINRYEAILSAELAGVSAALPRESEVKRAADIAPRPVDDRKKEQAAAPPQQVRPTAAPVSRPDVKIRRTESPQFEAAFGQKWLLIIGIVTTVFGIGYFLKYSFEQGWVGPAGRVAMAYAWGIIFMVAGNVFRKKNLETFGLYLIGGGIATHYFSTFAAFQLYHLIPQIPSFLIMVMITALAGALAVFYDTKWLAVLGIVGGFLTPVMLSTGQDNQAALMTYMTILNLGLLGIGFYKKWDLLNVLGFGFTYVLFAAWYGAHYTPDKFWASIVFLNLFYLIYSVLPFAYQFFRKQDDRMGGALIILPNSLVAFGFSYAMIISYAALEWVGLVSVSYAAIFLLLATTLSRSGKQETEAFVVLLAKAALFLIITVPVLFSRHWITIFWSAQAVVLLWMGTRLQRKPLLAGSYVLLVLTLWKFLFYDYDQIFRVSFFSYGSGGWYFPMILERLITSVLMVSSLYVFSLLCRAGDLQLLSRARGGDAAVFLALFGVTLFIVLNMETSLMFREYLPAARFAALSVLWTFFSVVLMVIGFKKSSPMARRVALGLFAGTLLKVFLFDMANISTPYRIVSFIILGLMLVGTSYLYYKYKDRMPGESGPQKP